MNPLGPVFCDYLNVSFAPDDCPYPELNKFFLGLGFDVEDSFGCKEFVYRPPVDRGGVIKIKMASGFALVSASGAACEFLRNSSAWDEYLSLLSAQPHKVTRLDASIDFAADGAQVIADLQARYPLGKVKLGRKAVNVTTYLAVRPDGRQTGTWYLAFKTKARLKVKVYDKAWQLLSEHGIEGPPRTRYEVTAGSGYGATLRDASEPSALFWHAVSPALLASPEGVPVWVSDSSFVWSAPVREFDAVALLRRRVEHLAELGALALVADELGPGGRDFLLRLVKDRLRETNSLQSIADSQTAA